MKTIMRISLAALGMAVLAGTPATAAPIVKVGSLGQGGVGDVHFNFGGGELKIYVESNPASPNAGWWDPVAYLFRDNGSPDNALTGTQLAYDDDSGTYQPGGTFRASFLSGNFAAGDYILSVARYGFSETAARTYFNRSDDAGLSFTSRFDGAVTVASAGVPEPATWALMILGFGGVGGAMRRRNQKVAVRYA